MSIGKNTIQGKRLLEIIEQSEAYDAQKKEIGELNTALMAAAKAEGLNPKAINYLKKRRKMKPHDRQEADDIAQAYSHAIGMDEEPPLFRAISGMARDSLTRERLLENFKALAPSEGDIILRMGGEPVRVYRDKDGTAQVEPYVEKAPRIRSTESTTPTARPARIVPDVSEQGATWLNFVKPSESRNAYSSGPMPSPPLSRRQPSSHLARRGSPNGNGFSMIGRLSRNICRPYSKDYAIRSMEWPLRKSSEIVEDETPVERDDNIISLGRRP